MNNATSNVNSGTRAGAWLRVWLFVMVLVPYAYFYQAGGWNQNSRFDLTRAMVERGTLAITGYHENTGDHAKRGDEYYCDKAPGLSWLGIPAYAGAWTVAGSAEPSPRYLAWSSYFVVLTSVSLIAAWAVVRLCDLLCVLGLSTRAAVGVALAFGLGTMAWPFATMLYGHQTSAALLLIPLATVVELAHRGEARKGDALRLVWVGILLGMAVVVEYTGLFGVVAVCGYALFALRSKLQVGWIVLGGLGPAALMAWYNNVAFGGPTVLPYEFSTQPHRSQGFFMGIGVPDPAALLHILFTPFRGLFFSSPWLLLAVPGGVMLWRSGRRGIVVVCVAVTVLFIWLNASLVDWEGGKTFGPRYLIPALPFLAVLAAGMLLPGRRSSGRPRLWVPTVMLVLALWSFSLMFIATSVRPEVQVEFRNPWTAVLVPRFMEGAVSVNAQSIDSYWPGDAPAAWNLGHQLGLDGRMSLVPLMLFLAAGAVAGHLLHRRASQ